MASLKGLLMTLLTGTCNVERRQGVLCLQGSCTITQG